jgi:hypothetical protein
MRPSAVRNVLLAAMVFELASPSWFQILHRDSPGEGGFLAKYDELRGAVEFLKAQGRPFRYMVRSDQPLPNFGSWAGMDAVDGYLASVSKDVYDYFGAGWDQRRLMMNTVYVLSKEKGRPEEEEIYGDYRGWKVFRNPDAWPRAWIEHSAENISMPGEGGAPPNPNSCAGEERVTVARQTPHRVLLKAELACPGYVVLADTYFPGWRADIDGVETTVYRAYGGLRALYVGPGAHTMEFVYRPRSVYWGGALTALGLVICVLLGLLAWRRGSPRAGIRAEDTSISAVRSPSES